jgi:putative tryptophan/tyrosine transport system ATP-binding protein
MLEINNLYKVFNSDMAEDLRKVALNDVSVTINKDDFVTIIGSNGSGKSTFFNTISGLYTPDSGAILLDNTDITNLKEFKRASLIGRVFQDPLIGTAGDMSVLENLYLAHKKGEKRKLKWVFNKKDEDYFYEMVKNLDLGIENNLNQKIKFLSGGQRQAITLLMATLKKPKLLLLDEHTAALDPKTANIVLELTKKIVLEQNIPTIMITHNISDAIKYGNRIIMFKDGKIVLDVSGSAKGKLTVTEVLSKFESI